MAEITAAAVKTLREKTDLPMMECKKALVEAEGDEARAIEILKENYKKVQVKRAGNETLEGRVFTLVKDDGSEGALVEMQCESAPVASGEDFVKFGESLVKQLLEGPGAASSDELMAQSVGGSTLSEQFDDMGNKIREKMLVNTVARVKGPVGAYVHHDGKTGVLFCAEGGDAGDDILRDVAMHIAALKPAYTTTDNVDDSAVAEEKARLVEEAKATGKPDNIIDKIVEGRMKNFYVEQGVLELQPFAKEDSKTVSQALAEKGFKAKEFVRRTIGE